MAEIGDAKQRDAGLINFCDERMHAGNGFPDGFGESGFKNLDQRRLIGELCTQLSRCVSKGAAQIMLMVPGWRDDVRQKPIKRSRISNQLAIQIAYIPVEQHAAYIKDNGADWHADQPWRALKRFWVLLMT